MKSFSELFGSQILLPIVQADSVEEGVEMAGAMVAAGLHLIEVVFRTEASIEALKAIKAEYPNLIVGAGTVTSKEKIIDATVAGADFIVTPAISKALLDDLSQCHLPVLPGVSTTADILLAQEYGYREVKLFPASLSGGAKFIATMSTIFPDICFCPTGGVNQDNRLDYLTLENCFAVGGSWIAPRTVIKERQWQKVTNACILANNINDYC